MPKWNGQPTRAEKRAARRAADRPTSSPRHRSLMRRVEHEGADYVEEDEEDDRQHRRDVPRSTHNLYGKKVPAGWFDARGETFMIRRAVGGGWYLHHVDGGEKKFATAEAAYEAAKDGRGPKPTYDL